MRKFTLSPACALPFAILICAPAAVAQTVLFDGISLAQNRAAALLVPADVTGDDYSLFARMEYGPTGYFNFFGELAGQFNGGATALPGLGWSATLYAQSDRLPLNIGFFNSFLFPLQAGMAPDAFITLAPALSRRIGPADGAHHRLRRGHLHVHRGSGRNRRERTVRRQDGRHRRLPEPLGFSGRTPSGRTITLRPRLPLPVLMG